MTINLIVALDDDNLIGNNNELPWHFKKDLKYFKETTEGNIVVMGRKTYESIGREGLPERDNIVLTNRGVSRVATLRDDYSLFFTDSIEYILQLRDYREVFIIGGATIYEQFLPYADKLYVTRVMGKFEGDTYFPDVDYREWNPVACEKETDNNRKTDDDHVLLFLTYERAK
jgi:dihydrofolate reductase